jgi:hypothetical protein
MGSYQVMDELIVRGTYWDYFPPVWHDHNNNMHMDFDNIAIMHLCDQTNIIRYTYTCIDVLHTTQPHAY